MSLVGEEEGGEGKEGRRRGFADGVGERGGVERGARVVGRRVGRRWGRRGVGLVARIGRAGEGSSSGVEGLGRGSLREGDVRWEVRVLRLVEEGLLRWGIGEEGRPGRGGGKGWSALKARRLGREGLEEIQSLEVSLRRSSTTPSARPGPRSSSLRDSSKAPRSGRRGFRVDDYSRSQSSPYPAAVRSENARRSNPGGSRKSRSRACLPTQSYHTRLRRDSARSCWSSRRATSVHSSLRYSA